MKVLLKILKQAVICLGLFILVEVFLFTSGLYGMLSQWLQLADQPALESPEWVVVLGGGGIPSESGLIRCFYGALVWKQNPEATCIVYLPADEDPEAASVGLMKQELMMRGVPEEKILMESKAVNTRQQAAFIVDMIGDSFRTGRVALVTSPFHIRRSYQSFRDEGCTQLGTVSSRSIGAEADMGWGTFFRYELWTFLEDQVIMLRELVALAWYKLKY